MLVLVGCFPGTCKTLNSIPSSVNKNNNPNQSRRQVSHSANRTIHNHLLSSRRQTWDSPSISKPLLHLLTGGIMTTESASAAKGSKATQRNPSGEREGQHRVWEGDGWGLKLAGHVKGFVGYLAESNFFT